MAVEDNQQIQDPSVKGTGGLKGLEGINRLKEKGVNIDTSILDIPGDYRSMMRDIYQNTVPRQNIGFVGINDSRLDKKITSASQLYDLANTRGELQPWYAQIGAGLAKGAILAGTTFLDGTIGLATGILTAFDENRFSGIWDNDFSKAMKSVNEWSEKALPNYYTSNEQNEPWYENIFTANFLGDKFIKNLGFTVGAFYSGGVASAGLKAIRLPQIIGAVAKSSKLPSIVTSGVGSVISAVNEGRVEALNNSTDWFNLQKEKLKDQHKARLESLNKYLGTEMYEPLVAQENSNYEATIGKLTEDRIKMGNMDLLMNIPILTASNIIQFGRMYANGFKTARKTTNIVNKAGRYSTEKSTGKINTKSLLNPLSEGTEEISQKAASTIAGLGYEQDVNNFYKAKIDPQAEQQTIDWVKAFAQGINETVNDGSSWEEFTIGALTGVLGILVFGKSNTSGTDTYVGRNKLVGIRGGIIGELREQREKTKRENDIVDYLNSRVQSPEFRNYYQGLIRHNKYQNDMNRAVEANDEFEFKNAEHAQLISDIVMFDNAGKLEDLITLINSAYDISDENLESIVNNTTSTITDESGKESKIGPFIDKNGNPMYSTPEGKQEMIDKLTQTKDEMLKTITDYTKIKDDIDVRTGQQLSDEQLEELTWLKSQIGNWQDRAKQLSSEVRPAIGTVLGSMSQLSDMYTSIKNEEGKAHAGLSDLYKEADENERLIKRNMSILETIRGLDDRNFAYLLSRDPKLVKGIKTVIEHPLSGIDADAVTAINSKIDDIVKLVNSTGRYNAKLKEYLENPVKLQEDIDNSTKTIAKEESKRKTDSLKSSLVAAQNLPEFRKILDAENDNTVKETTLKALEDDGNEMVRNYKEIESYNTDLQRAINSLDETPEAKAGALKLLQDQFNNSSRLEEMANPNSVYIDNANALYDSNLTPEENMKKFQEAQYTLLRAMNKVNNDARFKDRFTKEYKELKTNGKPNPSAPERDITGDSGTSTIPSIKLSSPVYRDEIPVGDITSTQVSDINKQLNDGYDTLQSFDTGKDVKRTYYRPAIPELHIEGTRNGDFRPFNVVAAEREKGVNFDVLYNYLRDNGAFTYVNEGNLKVGDEIGFMIDPTLEESMKSYSWYKGPTILLIDKKNNQVVGSLDSSQYSVNRYEGLSELEERIRNEYNNRVTSETTIKDGITYTNFIRYRKTKSGEIRAVTQNAGGIIINPSIINENSLDNIKDYSEIQLVQLREKDGKYAGTIRAKSIDGWSTFEVQFYNNPINNRILNNKFIATPTTKVSRIMIGKVPYSTEERSLANIPNVSEDGKSPIFGIMENGVLSTNGRLDDNMVIKPMDISQKEGRMYLLIHNAARKYSPAAVRVKHFNKTEFNPENIEVKNTQMYKHIQEAIKALAESLSESDVDEAVKLLKPNLYTRNLHINWFTSDKGDGIRFTKIQRDSEGNEIYDEKDGKRLRRETVRTVFFTQKKDENIIYSITGNDSVTTSPAPESKSTEEIEKEITDILLDFNLPIQVNLDMLNKGSYNTFLVDSGILTSNIADARVLGSWFTTDYVDSEGNVHSAVNPVSTRVQTPKGSISPVGGNEGVAKGTKVTLGGNVFYVDLENMTVTNQGNTRSLTESDKLLKDLAWAQNNFGDSTQSSMMVDNKVLTPSGEVLDRTTQKYLDNQEAQKVKDIIAGRKKTVADSKKVLYQIAENQKKVDRTKTDGEFYYILEDDGQYHEYERVHSKIGNNWIESEKQTELLKSIRVKLAKLSDDVEQYNNYLKNLSKYWNINLDSFIGKQDVKSRETIVVMVRDAMNETNSLRALNSGTSVDSVVRNFFASNETPVRPDNMSEDAFIKLIDSLTKIRSDIEARGERFLTNNIVLFHKYPDGTRIAGEVDILSVDANGNFRIYDVKTRRYSFHDFIDRYEKQANYFENKSVNQIMSSRDYYTLQLSAYKNLFESQYKAPVITLAVLPFVLSYNKNTVTDIVKEKGIIIKYNPNVNVPLASTVRTGNVTSTDSLVSVFNSAFETLDPVNDILPEYSLSDGKVGYFIKDGKLHKGYLSPVGQVNGVEVYMTKVPEITKGFGRPGEEAHVASNSYMAVFPNGNSITLIKNDPKTLTEQQAKDTIKRILNDNPSRVVDMSTEKTLIFDPTSSPKMEEPVNETPATILSTPSAVSGAAKAAQAEQAITSSNEEFEDELDLGSLRKVDEERKVWNQEKELAWIRKVLPQLSEDNRIRVVKGLIRVGNQGALAWGQFNNGIITLSNIAAEGTAYHEAFHVVFNLLLDSNERQTLLAEAKEMYGDKSDLDLEEDMAEGFREYVTTRESKGLLNRIKNFFKDLWIKVSNWNRIQPHLTAYYQMINEGRYAESNIPYTNINRNREEEYTQEMKDILTRAPRDSKGRLLAPNGKPSNLTERQYAQVRTKAFKDWFGDWENNLDKASKVIDENKEPLVVRHVSLNRFSTFKKGNNSFSKSLGYFTDSKTDIDEFTKNYLTDGIVYECFLNLKNPKIVNFNGDLYSDFTGNIDYSFDEDKSITTDLILEKVEKEGIYDGLIMLNVGGEFGYRVKNSINDYVPFNPNQIKSAVDNIGTFDNSNNDIRYRRVDNTVIPLSQLKSGNVIESSTFESLDADIQETLINKGWTQEKFDSISQAERNQAIKCIAI